MRLIATVYNDYYNFVVTVVFDYYSITGYEYINLLYRLLHIYIYITSLNSRALYFLTKALTRKSVVRIENGIENDIFFFSFYFY